MAKMLTLKNVTIAYDGQTILKDISASFDQGSLIIIVGRNGAGKSTLLKAMTGFVDSEGEILLNNMPIHQLSHQERAMTLGYLPQIVKAPEMSVGTLVAHGRFSRLGFSKKLSAADRQKIDEALRLTEMTDYRQRSLPTLSGGELKKAYCAMLMAQDPDIMLLDEPTAFLDVTATLSLMSLVKKLVERGKCIIMTCHDLPQAFSYANRIILLHDRTLTADEAPDVLVNNQKLLKEATGVTLKHIDDPDAYYHYILTDHN